MRSLLIFGSAFLSAIQLNAQTAVIEGAVLAGNRPVSYASIDLQGTFYGAITDHSGSFRLKKIPEGTYRLRVSAIGFEDFEKDILLKKGGTVLMTIPLIKSPQQLKEVVVTGVSRATRIRENPVAVVSVSSAQMEQTSGSNIIDVLVKNVPGLNAVKTGPNISKPFIRGLGYNRVLTLYDGMRQEGQQWGDEHGIEVDAYNIDRVEVIKGPSSLMYGSDALAGVISFFPYIPDQKDGVPHGKLTGEYQANNNLIGNGLRLDYSDPHFVFSLQGSYRMAKNYRNPVDGRVYLTGFNEKNLSTLLGYKSNSGFTNINFTWYDNRQGIPDGSRDSLTRKFTRQVYEGDEDTVRYRPIVSATGLDTYKIPALSQHIRHYRLYLHSSYKTGGVI